jgi:DNA mismatch repair protein MutS2
VSVPAAPPQEGTPADPLARFAEAVELPAVLEIFAAAATTEMGRAALRAAGGAAPLEDAARALEECEEARLLLERGRRIPMQAVLDPAALVRASIEHGRPLEGEQLSAIARAAHLGTALRQALRALDAEGYPRLRVLGDSMPALEPLELAIVSAIDERAKVRSTASARLSRLRDEIEDLRRRLDVRIERIADSAAVRPFLQSPKATLRNGRYVLPVKLAHRHEVPGILHDKSQTGATLYIEPHELVALGNELNALVFEERDEVTRVLWELTRQCYERREELEGLAITIARADAALAKALAARELGMRAPRLEATGPLHLLEARHPLLLRMRREGRLAGEVVPATVRLGAERDAGHDILIITGPNTGGKTVTLKTVGLLALMARAGLPIPAAEGSRVPWFTGLFADIGDEQAIEQSLSTFSAHVREVVTILARADEGSLVLLDELGAGTDPEEGAALGAAILEALLARGARAIVTTHLLSLKAFAFSRPRCENASVEFDPETLRPTYRLLVGVPGSSHAMTIARRHGMPEAVVARGEAIRALGKGVGETALIDEVERLRFAAAKDRAAAEEERRAAADARRAVEEERRALERERRTLIREADEAVESLYARLRETVERARGGARPLPKEALERVEALRADLYVELEHTPFAERRRAFARSLSKGKRVFVVSFEREGVVTRVNKEKERLTVKVGDVSLETGFDDVTWIRADPP